MSFLESVCSYITPASVCIYLAVHVLLYYICITVQSAHLINADKELNKKYACFARTDTD